MRIGIPVLFLVLEEKTLVFIPLSLMLIWAGHVEPFYVEAYFLYNKFIVFKS